MVSYDLPWFEWNGVRSTSKGVVLLNLPPVDIAPSERVSSQVIPGRSGSLTILEGDDIFDDVNLSCTCLLEDPYKTVGGNSVDQIIPLMQWLKGSGKVRFSNRPEGYRKGRIANQISFEKILRGYEHRSFSVQFRCDPFLYLDSGDTTITVTSSSPSKSITNEGNVRSLPLIKLTGTGEGTIMCGGSTMMINSFENTSYIMLDCEAKVAYKGSRGNPSDPLVLLGTRVSGEWLNIPEGTSHFVISGGITKAEITPRWRCI